MAAVLAAAFSGDPPMQWFVPDARRRPALLRRYFSQVLPALHLPRGRAWISREPAGAAIWVAPGQWPAGLRDELPVLRTLLAVFGRRPLRAVLGQHAIERGHPHEPHWYLDYIGVDPAAHGAGAGSALLAAGLERCDQEGMPACLNAGSPRSRALYERHGFQAFEEFRLPFGGPPLWRMWRDPA